MVRACGECLVKDKNQVDMSGDNICRPYRVGCENVVQYVD